MFGQLVVFCIISISLRLALSAGQLDKNHDVKCQPILAVVPVKKHGLPHFVKLHRCQGSINGFKPDRKNCTVKTFTKVPVAVNVEHQGEPKIFMLKNHTSCMGQCSAVCDSSLMVQNKSTCKCDCEHSQDPKGKCSGNWKWNEINCNCYCNLPEHGSNDRLRLDKENCQYVCNRKCPAGKKADPNDRCRCKDADFSFSTGGEDSDGMRQGELIAIVVIGEFVLLYLVFDFILYHRKTGLMYYVRCKCWGNPIAEPAQIQPETRRCLENADEMNNVPLADVTVDRNGHSHVAPGSHTST